MKLINLKPSIFIVFLLLVYLLACWSCQEKIHATKQPENSSNAPALDSILPIPSKNNADSITNIETIDSTQTVLLKTPYEQLYAPNTPFQTRISVFEVNLDTVGIDLINGKFSTLKYNYTAYPRDYLMLTNGGMFHPQGVPVGLFQHDSIIVQRLNVSEGYGNFFLLPNGVFYVTKDHQAGVLESKIFRDSIYNKETPLHIATQSGPMLLIDGKFHPKFQEQSTSKYIRSGVGVTDKQKVIFIISEEVVNLYTFAKIFKEKGCKNALYLDGAISTMYIKNKGDNIKNYSTRYGPIIGIYRHQDSLTSNNKVYLDSTRINAKNETDEK